MMDQSEKIISDPVLVEMTKNLSEAMKILEDGQSEVLKKQKYSLKDIPGPLQGSGQDIASILQSVQNLICGEEGEICQWTHNVGQMGHVALLGHSLVAYICLLDWESQARLATQVQSDTTLWLCRLFRYENGSAFYHEEDREGLLKVCRLLLHSHYEDFATAGFTVLSCRQPVIYQSSACRPGLGQYLCSQLGLPLSSLCTVSCNTTVGSEHQMDVFLLERIVQEDLESGRLPLLLIANAGTAGAGHTDKLDLLKDVCTQHSIWLHVEGVNLATLALGYVTSSVLAATRCDSMTLTLGPWLGLPGVPAVTLFRHNDPALCLAAGLTSTEPADRLRALPLWMSLQHLGHSGIVNRINHASHLSQRLLKSLRMMTSIKTSDDLDRQMSLLEALNMGVVSRSRVPLISGGSLWEVLGSLILSIVEDELNSPVVVFKFSQENSTEDSVNEFSESDREFEDTLNRWLGDQLALLVPASGVDAVQLEDEGVCVRFNPLMTSALLGTQEADMDVLVERLAEMVPSLSWTLSLTHRFREEVCHHGSLEYVEDLSWPGLGAVRYKPSTEEPDDGTRQHVMQKVNSDLLKKLQALQAEVDFSKGPEFGTEKNCIFVGMATEDLDVRKLVDTIAVMGKNIEESSKVFENMTDVVREGIHKAELQLQKANEEKLVEEGVLRQIPVVGSILNWFSPIQGSVKGQTFNLAEGSLNSTEQTYVTKTLAVSRTLVSPNCSVVEQSPGQKLFKRPTASDTSDTLSEGSYVSHPDKVETVDSLSPPPHGSSNYTTLDPDQQPAPEPSQFVGHTD